MGHSTGAANAEWIIALAQREWRDAEVGQSDFHIMYNIIYNTGAQRRMGHSAPIKLAKRPPGPISDVCVAMAA